MSWQKMWMDAIHKPRKPMTEEETKVAMDKVCVDLVKEMNIIEIEVTSETIDEFCKEMGLWIQRSAL